MGDRALIREQVPTEILFHAISKFHIRVVPRVSYCYSNFFVNSEWRVTHSEHRYHTMRRLDFRRLPAAVFAGSFARTAAGNRALQILPATQLVKWSLTRD